MSVEQWVVVDPDDVDTLQYRGWVPLVGDGEHRAYHLNPIEREPITNGRDLTKGVDGPNGSGLTSGPGMVNGLGLTEGAGDTSGSGGPPRVPYLQEELILVQGDEGPRGLEARRDLINGFSIGRREDPGSGSLTFGIAAWNRKVMMTRMKDLARRPLPGTDRRD
jgi:hypothetical protein